MKHSPHIIVTVTNDLTHDQRVKKVCDSLMELGFTPVLVGRQLMSSDEINRPYPIKRFRLIFTKGAAFYAEYNIRLFLYLLFYKDYASIHANDLDSLLGSFLASKFRKKKLVYDSHEYFTEVPELQDNLFAKRTWERIEEWIFPQLKKVITVNDSIADLYEKKYNIRPKVMRNIPNSIYKRIKPPTRADLGLPEDKTILIIQGTGINVDRGNDEMVEAMKHLDGFLLLIIGSGDVLAQLKEKVEKNNLSDKVMFKAKMPYEDLKLHTAVSDAGISVDKNSNINYKFSLPNKLFDFIHAGIPCIVSDLHEVKKVVITYDVGTVLSSHKPEAMASEIKQFFTIYKDRKEAIERNLKKAAKELTWENEAKVLHEFYHRV